MGDVVGDHHLLDHGAALAILLLGFDELLFEIGNDTIGQFAGALKLTLTLGDRQFVAGIVELLLEIGGKAELLLFRLPAGRQRIGFLFKRGKFGLQPLQPIGGSNVGFLLQRLALDFQLDDTAVELVELLRLGIHLHAQPALPPHPSDRSPCRARNGR